jgi:hypothetical protein
VGGRSGGYQPYQSIGLKSTVPPAETGADMRRREFLGIIGSAAAAWPVVARAQQSMPVVGYLGSEMPVLFAS